MKRKRSHLDFAGQQLFGDRAYAEGRRRRRGPGSQSGYPADPVHLVKLFGDEIATRRAIIASMWGRGFMAAFVLLMIALWVAAAGLFWLAKSVEIFHFEPCV
jgi:hypothetical protein